MFDEHFSENNAQPTSEKGGSGAMKKILIISAIAIFLLMAIGAGAFWFILSRQKAQPKIEEIVATTSAPVGTMTGQLATSTSLSEIKPGDFLIEQVSFQNFYQAPPSDFQFKINNYSLPLNVKTDIINYYDISRKLSLDPGLSSLDKNGFAIIDNPDAVKNSDFYSSFSWLKSKGIPILITADFLSYYYQNSLKLSFKHLEENLFYDSLQKISKELFDTARMRYEARRAKIGNTNDQILEGERLELAFFAVSLQLLKPQVDQITTDKVAYPEKFSSAEAKDFDFSLPEYLKDDVEREVALIRSAKETVKSPVLLYNRNYNDFTLPSEFRNNARLNNFYLAAKWLNSVFPLYYQSKDCPSCQLDENDWQVNLTAASFISQDFYSSYRVKNQWARIYKTLSFYKGLRGDLTYLEYHKVLGDIFGENYNLEASLGAENSSSSANFNQLRSRLLALRFPEWAGGYNRDDLAVRPQIGFRVLADFYSANDFISRELTAPQVGAYQGKDLEISSLCQSTKTRCKLLALDVVNLMVSAPDPNWLLNINYQGFTAKFLALKDTLSKFSSWPTSNYWSTIKIVRDYLGAPKSQLPIFGQNDAWKKRQIDASKAWWLNLQSSSDSVKVTNSGSLGSGSDLQGAEYYYLEPDLNLLNNLVANSQMILGMYRALQINSEDPGAYSRVEMMSKDLEFTRELAKKELSGQGLLIEDDVFLGKLVGQYQTVKANLDQFNLGATSLNYKFAAPKFLILISQTGTTKSFSVGPIFSYSESR